MHLKLHTATQSENHYFYVDAIIIEIHKFYRVISLSNGLSTGHVCNMVQTKPHCGSSKNLIKPKEIQQIASKRPQNYNLHTLDFSSYLSNIVKWAPESSQERPEAPREASDGPDKHQNQCQ